MAAGKASAVLLLLSPAPTGCGFQDMCLTLTKRTISVGSHKGQMSFPGGRLDPGESPSQAAQREGLEEVGLHLHQYEVLGTMSTISANHLGTPLTSVVAISHEPASPTRASPDEVDSVQYVHLSNALLHGAETQCRVIKHVSSFSAKVPHYFPCCFTSDSQDVVSPPLQPSNVARTDEDLDWFPVVPEDFPGELVWGLTSFILCEFVGRIAHAIEREHPTVADAQAATILKCSELVARDPD
ncbi:NUDIX hydrolase protein, conserved [Strigomonas culicis]|nr:NUDIX hydrolase protein, conserved [Strigomonas culicis]|eukprot:EPY33332.1 NUDIX hydrolase protein, conserved [Strigomonas culicis]